MRPVITINYTLRMLVERSLIPSPCGKRRDSRRVRCARRRTPRRRAPSVTSRPSGGASPTGSAGWGTARPRNWDAWWAPPSWWPSRWWAWTTPAPETSWGRFGPPRRTPRPDLWNCDNHLLSTHRCARQQNHHDFQHNWFDWAHSGRIRFYTEIRYPYGLLA